MGSFQGFFLLLSLANLGYLLGVLFGLLNDFLLEVFLGDLAHLGQLLLNLEFLGFLLLLTQVRGSVNLGSSFLSLLDFGGKELDSKFLGSLKLGEGLLPLLVKIVLLKSGFSLLDLVDLVQNVFVLEGGSPLFVGFLEFELNVFQGRRWSTLLLLESQLDGKVGFLWGVGVVEVDFDEARFFDAHFWILLVCGKGRFG